MVDTTDKKPKDQQAATQQQQQPGNYYTDPNYGPGEYVQDPMQTDQTGYYPDYPGYGYGYYGYDEEEQDDQESSVGELEKKEPDAVFARSLISSFTFYKHVMQVLLRFPLHIDRVKETGMYEFSYRPYSPLSIGYILTSVIIFIHFLLLVLSFVGILLDKPSAVDTKYTTINSKKTVRITKEQVHASELYLFQRNVAAVVIIILNFYHATISNFLFFKRRDLAVRYYNLWTMSVEKMRIDVGRGVLGPVSVVMLSFFVLLTTIIVLTCVGFIPIANGAATVFTMLTFRFFSLGTGWVVFAIPNFFTIKNVHAAVLFYGLVNAKSFIFLYLWTCLLLRNSFTVWNHRLERVLHGGESEDDRIEKTINRTGYDHLFRDHVCLLDLMAATDAVFTGILESYYSTQVVTICFEVFHAWQSASNKEKFKGARDWDALVMLLFLIITLLCLLSTSFMAAYVTEAAMEGLDVVRRKGTIGSRDEEELKFILTMYVSYAGQIEPSLSSGGYFNLDKNFLVGMVGIILSNVIVLFQFTPDLSLTDETKLQVIRASITEDELIQLSEGSINPLTLGYTFDYNEAHKKVIHASV